MQELGVSRKQTRRPKRRALVATLAILAVTMTVLANAGSVGAQAGDTTGVTDKAIKVGYIYSEGRARGVDVRARRRRVQRPDQGGER